MRRWFDWIAALVVALCGGGLLVLAWNDWQADQDLQRRGLERQATLIELAEEPEGQALAWLRWSVASGHTVTIQRRVGRAARAGWRVGDRVAVRYLPENAQGAQLASQRERGGLFLAAGLGALAAALGWAVWLLRAPARRRAQPPSRPPLVPRVHAFPVFRQMVAQQVGDPFQAAQLLLNMASAQAVATWIAGGEPGLLAVARGDGPRDVVNGWNRMASRSAPVEHIQEEPLAGILFHRDGLVGYHLRGEPATDALLVLHALPSLAAGGLELRFCRDSRGSAVLGFLALAPAEWAKLEAHFGKEAVDARFASIPGEFEAFERLVRGPGPG